MPNLYYVANCKNKIINLLLKNKNFIKFINPTPSECDEIDIADVLLGGEWVIDGKKYKEYGHIFDYNFVNDTLAERKTFVFVDTDIDTIRQDIFVDFNLYVYIFTPKELTRITNESAPTLQEVKDMGYFSGVYANRVDILCDIADRILNGSDDIHGIGSLKPSDKNYVTSYCPNNNYYGKCLKYKISNYNNSGDKYEN